MSIDNCDVSFSDLATKTLPIYMTELRRAMENPNSMADYCSEGRGVRSILTSLGRKKDFSGCYVLLRNNNPFYVGISRSVVRRLRQHGKGKSHFDASLAYQMASEKMPHKMSRVGAMANRDFRNAFDDARTLIRDSRVAFMEIGNPLELYLFEAYCAMELDTHEWNTFRTH